MQQASGLEFQIEQRIEESSKRGFRLDTLDEGRPTSHDAVVRIVIAPPSGELRRRHAKRIGECT